MGCAAHLEPVGHFGIIRPSPPLAVLESVPKVGPYKQRCLQQPGHFLQSPPATHGPVPTRRSLGLRWPFQQEDGLWSSQGRLGSQRQRKGWAARPQSQGHEGARGHILGLLPLLKSGRGIGHHQQDRRKESCVNGASVSISQAL